jgi:hypothetical protein
MPDTGIPLSERIVVDPEILPSSFWNSWRLARRSRLTWPFGPRPAVKGTTRCSAIRLGGPTNKRNADYIVLHLGDEATLDESLAIVQHATTEISNAIHRGSGGNPAGAGLPSAPFLHELEAR